MNHCSSVNTEKPLRHRDAYRLWWYLCFRVGTEDYGIDIMKVREICDYTRPPQSTEAGARECGLPALRGAIEPVIDLRSHWGVDGRCDAQAVMLVLHANDRKVGAVVDSVWDVVAIGRDQICPVSPDRAIEGQPVTGIVTLRQGRRSRTLVLVDIQQLLIEADLNPAN